MTDHLGHAMSRSPEATAAPSTVSVPRCRGAVGRRPLIHVRAPNPAAARAALEELADRWGAKYAAIIRLWESAWEEFIPFLDYDVEIRTVICSTNAIESLNARYRRAIRARGHFPTEQAALKCLHLVTDPWTPPDEAGHDGRCAGSQPSTRSPSPSPTAGPQQRPTDEDRRKHR